MTEVVKKYRCERRGCDNMVEVISKGFLGVHTAGKYPKGWGKPVEHWFCPSCYAEYTKSFKEFYNSFMKKKG